MIGEVAAPAKTSKRKTAVVDAPVVISAPRIARVEFQLIGTSPYVQARFSAKAMQQMKAKMVEGSTARKGTKREARDFDSDYQQAMHKSVEGWVGIPAAAFRNAMISACRLVGFKMTIGKLSVFVDADGFDAVDGIPLVRIHGEPEKVEMAVRNATGVADIRVRPMWREWSTKVRVNFDEDQFKTSDVANLLHRAGAQIGIGEGRNDSRSSCGLGWGLFRLDR